MPDVFKTNQGDLKIDYDSRQVWLSGNELALTDIEFRILHALTAVPNKVIEYDDLLENVWGEQYRGEKSVLQEHVRLLRHKIAPTQGQTTCIVNVRSVGYRFQILPEL